MTEPGGAKASIRPSRHLAPCAGESVTLAERGYQRPVS